MLPLGSVPFSENASAIFLGVRFDFVAVFFVLCLNWFSVCFLCTVSVPSPQIVGFSNLVTVFILRFVYVVIVLLLLNLCLWIVFQQLFALLLHKLGYLSKSLKYPLFLPHFKRFRVFFGSVLVMFNSGYFRLTHRNPH